MSQVCRFLRGCREEEITQHAAEWKDKGRARLDSARGRRERIRGLEQAMLSERCNLVRRARRKGRVGLPSRSPTLALDLIGRTSVRPPRPPLDVNGRASSPSARRYETSGRPRSGVRRFGSRSTACCRRRWACAWRRRAVSTRGSTRARRGSSRAHARRARTRVRRSRRRWPRCASSNTTGALGSRNKSRQRARPSSRRSGRRGEFGGRLRTDLAGGFEPMP